MKNANMEYIVTVRCKICGDIVSLSVPLTFIEATDAVSRFNESHAHEPKANPNPWET